MATQVFDKGFYLFKFDCKSGYHHVEISPITGNSLRSPGISAQGFLGIFNFVFQSHGRWKSVQAKDTYVDDDLDQRLSVFKSLGL